MAKNRTLESLDAISNKLGLDDEILTDLVVSALCSRPDHPRDFQQSSLFKHHYNDMDTPTFDRTVLISTNTYFSIE